MNLNKYTLLADVCRQHGWKYVTVVGVLSRGHVTYQKIVGRYALTDGQIADLDAYLNRKGDKRVNNGKAKRKGANK